MTIENIVREALTEFFPDEELELDSELIDSGIIDSIFILYLVSQLEENFNIEIPMEYVIAENFKSISSIIAFIESLI